MPQGTGTYGSQRGRPKKKKKNFAQRVIGVLKDRIKKRKDEYDYSPGADTGDGSNNPTAGN